MYTIRRNIERQTQNNNGSNKKNNNTFSYLKDPISTNRTKHTHTNTNHWKKKTPTQNIFLHNISKKSFVYKQRLDQKRSHFFSIARSQNRKFRTSARTFIASFKRTVQDDFAREFSRENFSRQTGPRARVHLPRETDDD